MGTVVKTYRALRQQNVAGQVRYFGDFVPEASEWKNLPVYIRSGFVEETFIDSDELDAALQIQRVKDRVEEEASEEESTDEEGSLDDPDEDYVNVGDPSPEDEPEDGPEVAGEAPKRALKIKKKG